jgi:hypothetical protein
MDHTKALKITKMNREMKEKFQRDGILKTHSFLNQKNWKKYLQEFILETVFSQKK